MSFLFLFYFVLYSEVERSSSSEGLFRDIRFLHANFICKFFIALLILGFASVHDVFMYFKLKLLLGHGSLLTKIVKSHPNYNHFILEPVKELRTF